MSSGDVDTVLEQALERLALLAEASIALSSTLDIEESLRRLCHVALPRLGQWCAVDLLGEHAQVSRAVVAHHDMSRLPTGHFEGPMPPAPEESADALARVLRGVGPLLLDEAALRRPGDTSPFHTAQLELFDRLGASSVIMAPLRARRQVLGALTLVRTGGQPPLTDDDVALVEDLAHRTSLAIDNSRLFSAVQHVAERLQRSLLPPLRDDRPFAVTARYVPAPTAAEVGGDWYDCFTLPSGASALIIGDVSGHDVAAAVGMSQLRNMIRALACDRTESPHDILRRLDTISSALYGGHIASCVYACLSGEGPSWKLLYSNAGHPPPLLIDHAGDTRYLHDGHDMLLGVDAAMERHNSEVILSARSTLLFYTDGLIERRGESIEESLRRLRHHAAALAREPLDTFCDELLADLGAGSTDDIALLAVRLPAP